MVRSVLTAFRVSFRDTVGLEIAKIEAIWEEGKPRSAETMLGITANIVIWPGATPGKKTLWLEDEPFDFMLSVEGYPTVEFE